MPTTPPALQLNLRLTPDEAQRLRLAMKPALQGRAAGYFVGHFYATLFKQAPQLRPWLPSHLDELQRGLLALVAGFFAQLHDPAALAGLLLAARPRRPLPMPPEALAGLLVRCFAAAYEEAALRPYPRAGWPLLHPALRTCLEAVLALAPPDSDGAGVAEADTASDAAADGEAAAADPGPVDNAAAPASARPAGDAAASPVTATR